MEPKKSASKTPVFSLWAASGLALLSTPLAYGGDMLLNAKGDFLANLGKPLSDGQVTRCEQIGREYANGRYSVSLDPTCAEGFLFNALPNAIRQTEDGSLLAFGFRSVLFMKKAGWQMISGPEAGLHDILAVAIDQIHQEIFVLDRNEQNELRILTFNAKYQGNVAPIRTVKQVVPAGATALAIDPVKNEILVASSQGGVHFFNRSADSGNRKPEASTAELRKISGSGTSLEQPSSVAIDSKRGEVYVLEKHSGRVLVFDTGAPQGTSPKKVISTDVVNAAALAFADQSGKLQVVGADFKGATMAVADPSAKP